MINDTQFFFFSASSRDSHSISSSSSSSQSSHGLSGLTALPQLLGTSGGQILAVSPQVGFGFQSLGIFLCMAKGFVWEFVSWLADKFSTASKLVNKE